MFVLFTKAQLNSDCKTNEDFQIRLSKFRYTLYADLMPQKEKIINYMDSFFSDTSSVIYKKSKKFYLDNNTDIKKFQKYEIEKYSKIDIDFEKFKNDTSFNSILSDTISWSYFSSIISSYCYLTFSPISYAFSLNNMLLARSRTPSEMGSSAIINSLAGPLVKTKMLQDNKWEIIIDNYEYIFIYEFNLSDNKIKVTKVLKRL